MLFSSKIESWKKVCDIKGDVSIAKETFSPKMISHLWPFKSSKATKRRQKSGEKISVGKKKFVSVAAFCLPNVYASHILSFLFSLKLFLLLLIPRLRLLSFLLWEESFVLPLKSHFIYWKTYDMLGVFKRLREGRGGGKCSQSRPTKHQKWKHGKQIEQTFMIYLISVFTFISDEKQFFFRFLVHTHTHNFYRP